MKRPNIRITGIEEGKEYQFKGIDSIFSKILEKNFLSLMKKIPMKIQKAQRTLNKWDSRKSLGHKIVKSQNM